MPKNRRGSYNKKHCSETTNIKMKYIFGVPSGLWNSMIDKCHKPGTSFFEEWKITI